jgi:RNA polymerase sigma-70 factor, ECF subfamily
MSDDLDARSDDVERVEALRRGDERAFRELVRELDPGLRRLVRHYVHSPAVAEEVVQETWLGVVRGIFAFEGRSSLKTWVFRILIHRARTRAAREKRTVLLADTDGIEVDSVPSPDDSTPEKQLLGEELRRQLDAAIGALPPNLRVVLTLRDVEGWPAEEVCNVLGIRETNQRVILHRARTRLRAALRPHLQGDRGAR